MKHAMVVYESMFGNTRQVAQNVVDGLSERARCTLVEVGAARTVIDKDVDLLVIGAPTHAFGLSTAASRHEAQVDSSHPVISAQLGVREWLAALVVLAPHVRVAAFDTHVKQRWVPGAASHRIVQALHRKGVRDVEARSFFVEGRQGPLVEGEPARAREWGRTLGRLLAETAPAETDVSVSEQRPGRST